MSEFPESVYLAYIDGELEPEREREFALHLMRSADARRRVVALQEEAVLLRDALQERARVSLRPVAARAPARGLALGIGPALAAMIALTAIVGAVADIRLPGGFDPLHPLQLFGVYEMFFDLVFWLRDEAPQLVDLVVAVAATAACSALLTFAVTAIFRRLSGDKLVGVAIVAALVFASHDASAVDLRLHQDKVTVPAGEVVGQTLVVSAQSLYVDGVVDGDLVAVVERAVIRGEVRGDVFALARSVEITGTVEGSVRAVCERVDLDGQVQRDVAALGDQVSQTPTAQTGRDFTAFGENVSVDGAVGRHLLSGADLLELRGTVGGNAELYGKRVEILDGAHIAGDLTTHLREGHALELSPGAVVVGEVVEGAPAPEMPHPSSRFASAHFYLHRVVMVASAVLVGMALYFFVPGLFRTRLETAPEFFRSLGIGLLALVGIPVAIVLCAVTVVGLPIALIAAAIFATALFAAFTVVGSLLGRALLRREPRTQGTFALTLVLGLVLMAIAISLPWIGAALGWLALLTGLGLLVEFALRRGGWWRGAAASR